MSEIIPISSLPEDGVPPNEQRCVRDGGPKSSGSRWRCKGWRVEGSNFCQKHHIYQQRKNREKKTGIKEPRPAPPPIAPAELRCHRKDGSGWQCKEERFGGFVFCQKHYLSSREKKKRKKNSAEVLEQQIRVQEKNRKLGEIGLIEGQKVDEEENSKMGERDLIEGQEVREMEQVGETEFIEGQKIEAKNEDGGLKDTYWYTAKILRIPNRKANTKILIEYDTLTEGGRGSIKLLLKKTVDPYQIRPLPPEQPSQDFQLNQIVDTFHDHGWCKGVVIQVLQDPLKYSIYLPVSKARVELEADKLRIHQDWVGGKWVRPQDKETNQQKSGIQKQTVDILECVRQSEEMVSEASAEGVLPDNQLATNESPDRVFAKSQN